MVSWSVSPLRWGQLLFCPQIHGRDNTGTCYIGAIGASKQWETSQFIIQPIRLQSIAVTPTPVRDDSHLAGDLGVNLLATRLLASVKVNRGDRRVHIPCDLLKHTASTVGDLLAGAGIHLVAGLLGEHV